MDFVNATVWIPDSKTPNGIAEIPLTPLAVEAFKSQMLNAGPGPFLFPSDKNPSGHHRILKTAWRKTLKRAELIWEEWTEFFLEGTEISARQAADTAQILHLFEADRQRIRAVGRKAASSLAVHEYLQAHPLTKIGPAARDLKLSVPTVTSALETLTKLKIAKESTGKRSDRLFAYPRYLNILSEGTEPLRS